MTAWVYLFLASIFEVGWIFSLKFINVKNVKGISFESLKNQPLQDLLIVLPFIGYIVFGIGNIYCFSIAMKGIPASTAFAVWMAVALAGVKLVEVIIFKEPSKATDYIFLALILVAIIGLKRTN
jgi:quaternary ammonium compound-resistance protein SugE